MKETPIPFKGPMVRAILDGRKTQTRRIIKNTGLYAIDEAIHAKETAGREKAALLSRCPYGKPGNRLKVKEAAWMWCEKMPNGLTKTGRAKWLYLPLQSGSGVYCADHPSKPNIDVVSPNTGNQWEWRKKITRFLPSWASRITLEVVNVRVERLQDISEEDAKAEGTFSISEDLKQQAARIALSEGKDRVGGKDYFRQLWQSINGTDSWNQNPWVWVIEFRRIQP